MITLRSAAVLVAASALIAFTPDKGGAQFYSYPSFQIPSTSWRDFNFAVADVGDAGTSFVFQWREGLNARSHLQIDAGLADPGTRAAICAAPSGSSACAAADTRLIIGGGYAYRLYTATGDMPLDMVFTVGLGGSFGDGRALMRIPVGLSVGRRFSTDSPIFITPYAHPRLSFDSCSKCGASRDRDTDLGLDMDLGAGIEFSPSIALRASLLIKGSDFAGRDNGFGLSLTWTPQAVR